MNAEPAQMVPGSGWTGGRMLGVDRVYQVVAGEVLQALPKESRLGFVDDALWRARGLALSHWRVLRAYTAFPEKAGLRDSNALAPPRHDPKRPLRAQCDIAISNNSGDGHDANDAD
jgi:hypothetical protein